MPVPPEATISLALSMSLLAHSPPIVADGAQLDALCDSLAAVIRATVLDITLVPVLASPGGAVTGTIGVT